jgi:predicted nuclease of predicted toxin-antitoxin system
MKLLFDENLSHKLTLLLEDLFPNSIHVRDVGLKSADDPLVWEYANTIRSFHEDEYASFLSLS